MTRKQKPQRNTPRQRTPAPTGPRVLTFEAPPTQDEHDDVFELDDREVALIQRYRALDPADAYSVSVELLTRQERKIVECFRDLTATQQVGFSTAMYLDAFHNIQARINRAKAGTQQTGHREDVR